jgi:hypothetical protein
MYKLHFPKSNQLTFSEIQLKELWFWNSFSSLNLITTTIDKTFCLSTFQFFSLVHFFPFFA